MVKKTPKTAVKAARGVRSAANSAPAMANRPMGRLKDGLGMTVGLTAFLLFTTFLSKKPPNNCHAQV